MPKLSDDLLKRLGVLEDTEDAFEMGYIPTGSLALNYIVGGAFNKGYPIGRMIEIYGEASTGKTVLLTHAIREAQALGYYTGLADNEFSYDPVFSKTLGVDNSKLLYDRPDTVIKCLTKVEDWVTKIREVDKDTPILMCIDSLAGQSSVEEEKSIGEFSPTDGARRALEIGQGLRQMRPILQKNKVCLIVINQTRQQIGVMYGDSTAKSGGGKGLAFWVDISLLTLSNKTSDVIKDKEKPIGIKGSIRNKKNKIAIPFQECEFKLIYNQGLDRLYGVLPMLVAEGKLTKTGGWYAKPTGEKFQEGQFYEGKIDLTDILGPYTTIITNNETN